jgi:hypothetical protein
MTKFEVGKEYTLREGSKAKVFMVDNYGQWPILGALCCGVSNRWTPVVWSKEGHSS